MMDTHRVLFVYRAASGQWAGRLIEDGEEISGIGGCTSRHDVEASILATGSRFEQVCEVNNDPLPALLNGKPARHGMTDSRHEKPLP
jgi:hypothetical protein